MVLSIQPVFTAVLDSGHRTQDSGYQWIKIHIDDILSTRP